MLLLAATNVLLLAATNVLLFPAITLLSLWLTSLRRLLRAWCDLSASLLITASLSQDIDSSPAPVSLDVPQIERRLLLCSVPHALISCPLHILHFFLHSFFHDSSSERTL